jgi:hypothetical protein
MAAVSPSNALEEAMPWIGGNAVRPVRETAAGALLSGLERLGFRVVRLEGERIVSPETFFGEMSRALPLEGRPASWDELVASLEAARPRLEGHVALVWHRADYSAFFSLATVVAASHLLLGWRDAVAKRGTELELFLLGATRDFAAPEGATA